MGMVIGIGMCIAAAMGMDIHRYRIEMGIVVIGTDLGMCKGMMIA